MSPSEHQAKFDAEMAATRPRPLIVKGSRVRYNGRTYTVRSQPFMQTNGTWVVDLYAPGIMNLGLVWLDKVTF